MAVASVKKYNAIREEYQKKYLDYTYKEVRIYTDEYAFIKLSEKYYLAPSTIEHIVYFRGGYRK